MRSILARIFISFWLIIGITIGVAALAGYYYAERMRHTVENFESSDILLTASEILSSEGKSGLRSWLRAEYKRDGISLYVIDEKGHDLLFRRVPRDVAAIVHHRELPAGAPQRKRHQPGNLRPARPLPQLVTPKGEVLTFVASSLRHPYRRWFDERAMPMFLLIALLASAGVSYLLARTLSRPVRRLRAATVAIADGDLSTRLSDSLHRRRDELGLLARDFDRMAARLEQAAAQQSELSSNISHELRSPLARLRVALELARRQAGELPEFSRIDSEAERLDELIGQILRFSRLDAADVESAEELQVDELLQEVIDNVVYEMKASGRDERIAIDLQASHIPPVIVYRSALTSAVENILRNAVAHSPAGSTVEVAVAEDLGDVRLQVRDRGTGVDEDELERLFEPFYRTRRSQQPDGRPGNGLGLAIAARAVSLHHGHIAAANRPGGGLEVTVRLPLVAVA